MLWIGECLMIRPRTGSLGGHTTFNMNQGHFIPMILHAQLFPLPGASKFCAGRKMTN